MPILAVAAGLVAPAGSSAAAPERGAPAGREVPPRRLVTILPPEVVAQADAQARSGTAPEGPRPAAEVATPAGGDGPVRAAPTALSTRADAGDDQIGLVGRQITLNGGRSEPRGRIGYRWLQTGGPQTVSKTQEGPYLTFTPQAPGIYRFALLVASGSEISEPDIIDVAVGTLGPSASLSAPTGGGLSPAPPPAPIEELARAGLSALNAGPEAAAALASTFEAVADRMDLYANYADIYSEVSRRLEAFIPAESRTRAVWIERVFTPLTVRLVEQMRAEGLDLSRAEGATQPMSAAQKARLAEQYRGMAQGFRATLPPR